MFRLYSKHLHRLLNGWYITDPKQIMVSRSLPGTTAQQQMDYFNSLIQQIFISAWKTTHVQRLQESTAAIRRLLEDTSITYHFLDVASADGSTSAYTHKCLTSQGYRLCTTSTDKDPYVYANRLGILEYFYSVSGEPFLCNIGNLLVFRLYDQFNKDPFSKGISRYLKRRFYMTHFERKALKIDLRNPITDDCSDFTYEYSDIFKPEPRYFFRFHIVRCSNVMNYFNIEKTIHVLRVLKRYLKNGGYLIVSQCDERGVEAGTIFQRSESSWREIESFNRGSHIASLIGRA